MPKKRLGRANLSKPTERQRKQSQISTAAAKATSNVICNDAYDIVPFRGSDQSHLDSKETDRALREDLDDLLADDRVSHGSWHLPYTIQHDLLNYLQRELENMCQRFGQAHFPNEMREHRWTDPSSLELTAWIKFIRSKDIASTSSPFNPIDPSLLNQILSSAAKIRHNAVHRGSSDIRSIGNCVQIAKMFAELHCDTDMVDSISNLSQAYEVVFEESCSEQQKIRANLRSWLVVERRKLEEKAIEEFEREREKWCKNAGHNIARILSEMALKTESGMKDEKHPSEESPGLEIEGVLRDSVIGEAPSAEQDVTRTFPQQGSWQLQCHQTMRVFVCTRCKNLSQSKFVACDIARRDLPLCNKCYGQLLAESRRATSGFQPLDHTSIKGEMAGNVIRECEELQP